MTPERYQQIKEVMALAVAYPPERRPVFLAAACAGDDALLSEVESLLAHEQPAREFIEESAFAVASKVLAEPLKAVIGSHIGPYRVTAEIGSGGMGVVYLAERDDEHFAKRVAIKVVKRGMDTESVLRRFRNERQILAELEHPNIARIIDGGATGEALPYFVMEYVDGKPIDVYCDDRQLTIDERLALFRDVCAAVQFAHQHLVIHRDLKPDNILVTSDGTPKLLDFGIAKLLHPDSADGATEATATGLRIMTPEYASPEQARGDSITTASDVYSLGVLLYQLLTGHRPYRLKDKSPLAVARVICEQEPEEPSTAISRIEDIHSSNGGPLIHLTPESVSRTREGEPTKLRRRLAGDLDNIVLMAMRKEPARRYSSVAQFAEDLRRHLEGRPVIAHRDGYGYRTSKFIRRHQLGVAAAVAVAVTLIAGIIATSWQAGVARREARKASEQARVATEQRDRAQVERVKAERINQFLQEVLGSADPAWYATNIRKGPQTTVDEMLAAAAQRADSELTDQPEVLAGVLSTTGRAYLSLGRLDLAEQHLRKALELNRRLHDTKDPEVAMSMALLGEALILKGNYAEAESLLQQALTLSGDQAAGDGTPPGWMIANRSDLGQIKLLKGDLSGAEACFREALKQASKLSGSQRALAAVVLGNLGRTRESLGDLDEAESLYRNSIAEYRKLPGRPRMELATSLTFLGDVLRLRGKYAESESALQEALELLRTTVDEKSPYLGAILYSLGQLRYAQGNYVEAEKDVNQSLKIFREVFPEGHVTFAGPWTALGLIMNRTGRSTQAETYIRQGLELRVRLLPRGHFLIAHSKGALGECLMTQKQYAEAEPALIESYDETRTALGEQHPRTAEAEQRLRQLYESWGKSAAR